MLVSPFPVLIRIFISIDIPNRSMSWIVYSISYCQVNILAYIELQRTFAMAAGKTMEPATWLRLLSAASQWEHGDFASSTLAVMGSLAWDSCSMLLETSVVAWDPCRPCWGCPVSQNPAIEISTRGSRVPGHSILQSVVRNIYK